MKKALAVPLLITLALAVTTAGCSYKELDEQLQSTIEQQMDGGVDGYTSDGRAYAEVPPPPEDNIELSGLEQSFSADREYTVLSGEQGVEDLTVERGTQGLTYTLKDVQAFDSIYDSGVDMYGCRIEDRNFLESTPFILVEVEAFYEAPDGAEAEIVADAGELSGTALASQITRQMEEGMYPEIAFFSLRPDKDDPSLDYQHEFFLYRIKDGEPVTFQVGLFCGQSYMAAKNVYLEVNEIPSIEEEITGDKTRKLFVLFPESEE